MFTQFFRDNPDINLAVFYDLLRRSFELRGLPNLQMQSAAPHRVVWKVVTSRMNEIHLPPFFGSVWCGVVCVVHLWPLMRQKLHMPSYFKAKSTILAQRYMVHILPLSQINAWVLYDCHHKFIIKLEKSGFRVIAVIPDNNSINRKVMS